MKKPEEIKQPPAFSEKWSKRAKLVAGLVLVVCGMIAVAGFVYDSPRLNFVAVVVVLFLAIIGFCTLVLFLSGVLLPVRQVNKQDWLMTSDLSNNALFLTDISGFIVKSNALCKKLSGFGDAQTVFSFLSQLENAEQILYRLSAKALAGQSADEDMHAEKPLWTTDGEYPQYSYNLSVRPIRIKGETFLIWQLKDKGSTPKTDETPSNELQQANSYLDKAPVGFLSVNFQGTIRYLNATLANWLDIDLSNFKVDELLFDDVFRTDKQVLPWTQLSQKIEHSDGCYQFSVAWLSKKNGLSSFIAFATTRTGDVNDEKLYQLVLVPMSYQSDMGHVFKDMSDVFRYYFENSPIAIALVGKQGALLDVNRPFGLLFNIKRDDKNRMAVSDLVAEKDKEEITTLVKKLAVGGRLSLTTEVSLANNDDRHFRLFFLGLSRDFHPSANEIAILTAIETTAQKTLEDKMAQGQKLQAVGQLAGGIAHDFNNVLTAIIMSCDLLLASHRSSDPAHADLINIKNNADRAASLVQQLLAFSRRQTLRPEVVDLTELLSDVRNLLMPLLGSNIHLKFNHGRDLWDVKVDQASFQRVLMNLVINARDAMPAGGTITIATTNVDRQKITDLGFDGLTIGDYVELDVKDTGTGIPKAVQEKMFEPFFTTKEVGKGTGLGLSMVYGIVKQTGGNIYCESEEGWGTTFRIFLPRFVANAPQDEPKKIEPTKSQAEKNADLSGSATVLLVEDEAAVRMGGLRALQSRGYTVLEAENGLEALDVIAEHNGAIDLVVSDVVMPEMDGPTLLGEMRAKYPDIKFVFVSGYAKDAFAKNLPPDAVFGFLSKPFTLKQLAMKVKEMLADDSAVH